jgi:hypothetical protein
VNSIGLAIACWNRPHYFVQLINSLEANVDNNSGVDFHLFLDGNECRFRHQPTTDQKLIRECEEIWKKSILPDKQIHKRYWNSSIAIHQYELMQTMSSLYEKFIFLEDDVVVSPNFMTLMKQVLNQFKDDENVFSISPGFKLLCKSDDIDKNYDAIKFSEGHFWAEGIWAHKWKKILPRFSQYVEIVRQRPYSFRDNGKIKELFVKGGRVMPTTSQDNAKDWAISLSGMKRARMVVNRATGIGDIGFHSSKEKLSKSGDGHNVIPVITQEKSISKWRIV